MYSIKDNVYNLQVTTFLMMYRTHCQRILDTVIRANFDEVCLKRIFNLYINLNK